MFFWLSFWAGIILGWWARDTVEPLPPPPLEPVVDGHEPTTDMAAHLRKYYYHSDSTTFAP